MVRCQRSYSLSDHTLFLLLSLLLHQTQAQLSKRLLQIVVLVVSVSWVGLAGVASAGVCSNEAMRAGLGDVGLPDCRAYELVSPAGKDGEPVAVTNASSVGVGEGTRVVGWSIAAFAGSTQATVLNFYVFSREAGGWAITPRNVPAGYVDANSSVLLAASPDLSRGLFEYKPLSVTNKADTRFYVQGLLPTGPAVEVGPRVSPAALESNPPGSEFPSSEPSASSELSRVLFMLAGPGNTGVHELWPGDETVGVGGPGVSSLYEYVGTGNTHPRLVGVDSSGRQLSQCGTSLGYPERGEFRNLSGDDVFNAVSEDGSRVFFTAAAGSTSVCAGVGLPVSELFARVGGGSSTVNVSEPSEADCLPALCGTSAPREAVFHEAVFQGASEDGSKVFFLTSQALLRNDLDETTDLYLYDFNAPEGRRIVELSGGGVGDATPGEGAQVQGVARVSEDGSHVYFVARGRLTTVANSVGRMAVSGEDNLYVFERDARYPSGHLAFVGTLSPGDEARRLWSHEDFRPVDVSRDGRFLVFSSSADLTLDDASGLPQVFEYDAQAETLVRVSRAQGVSEAGAGEFEASIVHPNYTGSWRPAPQQSSVSDNGIVVFQSEAGLTLHALVGHNNVYEYREGVLSLISDGQDRSLGQGGFPTTRLVGIDATGQDIFFATVDRLVPQDGDTQVDIYDAREGGGILPPSPAVCEGDGCQGPLSPSPLFSPAGSVGQLAGEQVVEPPPVKKPVTHPKPKTKAKHGKKKAKHHKRARRAGRPRHGSGGAPLGRRH